VNLLTGLTMTEKLRQISPLLSIAMTLFVGLPVVHTQGFDPRPSLNTLISAFQRCGPPAAYQMLSPYLFTLIAQQTGGAGCYSFIAQAGPVTSMEVIDSREFPVGPVFAIRVTHAQGPVDWFIGFNRATGRIEYLSYQNVTSNALPSVRTGPDAAKTIGGQKPTTDPDKSDPDDSPGSQNADLAKACRKFPQMCPTSR
jgi:hypothetical protein